MVRGGGQMSHGHGSMGAVSPSETVDRFAWTPRVPSRRVGAGVLVVYLVLVVWALLHGTTVTRDTSQFAFEQTDGGLYRAIVHRMQDGRDYYAAVSAEQPGRNYPTTPVVTVREPTLAWITAAVGRPGMVGVMIGLVLLALGLSLWVWEHTERRRTSWVGMVLMSVAAVGIFAVPRGVWTHEVWMSLLVYLGLMAWGLGLVRFSVALLLAAALVRELAAPVMLLMLVVAWHRGRRREAVMWAAGVAVFAAFFGLHAVRVGDLVPADGAPSDGWLALGGWPFVVDALRANSMLSLAPYWFSAVVVPLGVLGWLSRSGRLFDHVSWLLLACTSVLCVVGRPDNTYWGMFLGPFVIPGVLMALDAAAALARPTRAQDAV